MNDRKPEGSSLRPEGSKGLGSRYISPYADSELWHTHRGNPETGSDHRVNSDVFKSSVPIEKSTPLSIIHYFDRKNPGASIALRYDERGKIAAGRVRDMLVAYGFHATLNIDEENSSPHPIATVDIQFSDKPEVHKREMAQVLAVVKTVRMLNFSDKSLEKILGEFKIEAAPLPAKTGRPQTI